MKYLVLVFSLLTLSVACKRRPGQVPTHGSIEWKESVITASAAPVTIIPQDENSSPAAPAVSHPLKKKTKKVVEKLNAKTEKIPLKEQTPLSIDKPVAVKKEIPTALSNAMWMTFIGLGGVLLMLALLSWFDTSVFLVLFGIVFIIGVISWIMYKLKAKPKVQ